MEIFKAFSACKIVLVATHQNSQNIQRLFRLQSCPRRKSSISWKYSKTFSPAKISQQQPIIILKKFKDFSACEIALAANHRYPGNIQRLFRLQICLSRKSSISWKYSKIFSPANLSQPQIIDILEIFKDFFACKIVVAATHQYINILKSFKDFFACKNFLAANHLYPGNIQRLFRLQNVLVATHQNSQNIQRLFRLQNCLSRKSLISWKYAKTFSPAELSQQQPINTSIF